MIEAGDYEQAVNELQLAVRLDPTNEMAIRELGRAQELWVEVLTEEREDDRPVRWRSEPQPGSRAQAHSMEASSAVSSPCEREARRPRVEPSVAPRPLSGAGSSTASMARIAAAISVIEA